MISSKKIKTKETESETTTTNDLIIGTDSFAQNNPKLRRGGPAVLEAVRSDDATVEGILSPNKIDFRAKALFIGSPNNPDAGSPDFEFSISSFFNIILVPKNPDDPDGPKVLVFNDAWEVYTNGKNPDGSELTEFVLPTFPEGEEGVPEGLKSGQPYMWDILGCALTNIGEDEEPFNFNNFEFRGIINTITHCGGNAIARVAP